MSINNQPFWIKGDAENPLGRAVFYAEIKGGHYALVAGTSLADLIITEKADPKAIDNLLNQIAIEQREQLTITLPVPINSISDLQYVNADLIHIGVYKTKEECIPYALKKAGEYLQRIKPSRELSKYSKDTKDLTQRVNSDYISPLIEAYRRGNYTQANEILHRAFDFFRGTIFIKDVYELFKHIYDKLEPNRNLVNAMLGKIQAVHDENFEEAAKLRDLVKKLTQSTGQTPP